MSEAIPIFMKRLVEDSAGISTGGLVHDGKVGVTVDRRSATS